MRLKIRPKMTRKIEIKILKFVMFSDCNCDPAGVIEAFAGCGSVPKGELCQCKERVKGRICNECKPLYWNMQTSNPLGCDGMNQLVNWLLADYLETPPQSGTDFAC